MKALMILKGLTLFSNKHVNISKQTINSLKDPQLKLAFKGENSIDLLCIDVIKRLLIEYKHLNEDFHELNRERLLLRKSLEDLKSKQESNPKIQLNIDKQLNKRRMSHRLSIRLGANVDPRLIFGDKDKSKMNLSSSSSSTSNESDIYFRPWIAKTKGKSSIEELNVQIQRLQDENIKFKKDNLALLENIEELTVKIQLKDVEFSNLQKVMVLGELGNRRIEILNKENEDIKAGYLKLRGLFERLVESSDILLSRVSAEISERESLSDYKIIVEPNLFQLFKSKGINFEQLGINNQTPFDSCLAKIFKSLKEKGTLKRKPTKPQVQRGSISLLKSPVVRRRKITMNPESERSKAITPFLNLQSSSNTNHELYSSIVKIIPPLKNTRVDIKNIEMMVTPDELGNIEFPSVGRETPLGLIDSPSKTSQKQQHGSDEGVKIVDVTFLLDYSIHWISQLIQEYRDI